MEIIEVILALYFSLWMITMPLTIWVLFKVITELLDLILNTGKLNKLLEHSDNLDYSSLKDEHLLNMIDRNKVNESFAKELNFELLYNDLKKGNRETRQKLGMSADDVITAKELLHILKQDNHDFYVEK